MIVARGNLQYIEGLPVVIYLDEGVAYGDLHVHVHVCTVEGLPYGGDACCDLHVHVYGGLPMVIYMDGGVFHCVTGYPYQFHSL